MPAINAFLRQDLDDQTTAETAWQALAAVLGSGAATSGTDVSGTDVSLFNGTGSNGTGFNGTGA
jgi:hypothetical protein